jgi:hypothetical protein
VRPASGSRSGRGAAGAARRGRAGGRCRGGAGEDGERQGAPVVAVAGPAAALAAPRGRHGAGGRGPRRAAHRAAGAGDDGGRAGAASAARGARAGARARRQSLAGVVRRCRLEAIRFSIPCSRMARARGAADGPSLLLPEPAAPPSPHTMGTTPGARGSRPAKPPSAARAALTPGHPGVGRLVVRGGLSGRAARKRAPRPVASTRREKRRARRAYKPRSRPDPYPQYPPFSGVRGRSSFSRPLLELAPGAKKCRQ